MMSLLMRVRVRPCRARDARSSSGRVTRTWLSSTLTSMGWATVSESSPLGPLTVTTRSATETVTPAGMSMGSFPIRDIIRSPHVGDNFSAHALLLGLAVRQKTVGGGQDGDAEATEDLGEFRRLRVDAKTGLRHALEARDRALTARAVLQRDREGLADARIDLREAGHVTLLLEHRDDALLEFALRQRHLLVVRRGQVTQSGQQIYDRVCHGHMSIALFMRYR